MTMEDEVTSKSPPFARVKLSPVDHRRFMSAVAANGDTAQEVLLSAVRRYLLARGQLEIFDQELEEQLVEDELYLRGEMTGAEVDAEESRS